MGGEIPKPPLKAVLKVGFVSSLASFGLSVARGACQCANKLGGKQFLLIHNNLNLNPSIKFFTFN
jgi:hypothetical protein